MMTGLKSTWPTRRSPASATSDSAFGQDMRSRSTTSASTSRLNALTSTVRMAGSSPVHSLRMMI